ncbi:transmembrane protein 201 isoform X2 [Lingula anatina]|uniref:Transmembrane protein 201 isoform X2 n=1 Tax=Lingula anatina TaxID=7574 RepID=A0A1S3K4P0_LINAN|nr:transmembrane protein 201 isoform X2 [Lingula anatina]|eukprot:XP_013417487.1 transmembrane protein 201 isoform X2 [Lingula anatina]
MTTVLPLVAGTSSAIAAGAILYRIIRPKFSIRVNCWFCCRDTVVPYGNKDCWDCPHCEQYNGFAQDGDYNKPIPSQYYESMNHPMTAVQTEDAYKDSRSVLCEACSRNQLLKIKQLANFVPCNEGNYDTEVAMYRDQLEHTYQLCKTCHIKVKQTLNKQDQVLQRKMMKQHLKTPDSPSACSDHFVHKVGPPAHINLLRLTSLLCAITLLVINFHSLQEHSDTPLINLQRYLPRSALKYLSQIYSLAYTVVFLGFFSGITATFLFGKDRLVLWDAVASFVWLGLLFVHSSLPAKLTRLQAQDSHILQVALALLCTLLSMLCWLIDRTPRSQRRQLTRGRHRRASSFMSDTSDLSHHSSPGADRMSASSEDFDSVSQVSNHTGASGHMTHQISNHMLTTSHVTRHLPNHNDTRETLQSGHPIDSKLETMSLGPPSRRKTGKGPGVRSLNGSSTGHNNNKEMTEEESNSSSSSSSLCPVDSSCPYEKEEKSNTQSKSSLFWQSLLGVSIGLNVAVAAYVAADYFGLGLR